MTDKTFKFPIKNRRTGVVIFKAELDADYKTETRGVQSGMAVRLAVEAGTILRDADLRGANLCDAYLRDADLRGADLRDAILRGAYLRDADLRGAILRGAYLGGAILRGAYLRDANLGGAILRGAYLGDANLGGADLRGADLRGADLRGAIGIANRIIDGGLRSDGYRFLLTRTDPGKWRVKAGWCRDFTLTEAREHWGPDHQRAAETNLIINHMVALAERREWPEKGEEA